MYRHSVRLSLLAVSGLFVLSAPHIATARTMHALRPPSPQCSSGPCRGSCAICPPCTPGTVCPERPCRLGSCQTDASRMCQCVPVQSPTPTPTPTPTSQCSGIPCGGSCTIPAPCTPLPGTACPRFVLLGECQADTSGTCQCVPVHPPMPTPTASPSPCVDTVLCIRGFSWSPTQCQCVPDNVPVHPPTPTPTASPSPSPCVDTVLCIRGFSWSPTQCQCVPDNRTPTPCVDTVFCIRGSHWSPQLCTCVPDHPHGPHSPQSPHAPQRPHAPGSAP
jgi:hypothetical protein